MARRSAHDGRRLAVRHPGGAHHGGAGVRRHRGVAFVFHLRRHPAGRYRAARRGRPGGTMAGPGGDEGADLVGAELGCRGHRAGVRAHLGGSHDVPARHGADVRRSGAAGDAHAAVQLASPAQCAVRVAVQGCRSSLGLPDRDPQPHPQDLSTTGPAGDGVPAQSTVLSGGSCFWNSAHSRRSGGASGRAAHARRSGVAVPAHARVRRHRRRQDHGAAQTAHPPVASTEELRHVRVRCQGRAVERRGRGGPRGAAGSRSGHHRYRGQSVGCGPARRSHPHAGRGYLALGDDAVIRRLQRRLLLARHGGDGSAQRAEPGACLLLHRAGQGRCAQGRRRAL